jgi:hypothetical protein
MAIIPTKEEGGKPAFGYSIIALFAAAILASLAAFFWPIRLPENFREAILNHSERRLSKLQLNLAVLQDPVFQTLASYGEFPLTVPEGGRANPFTL